MKKHLILTTTLFSFAALLLSNCSKTDEPLPSSGGASSQSAFNVPESPVFNGNSSTANELDNLTWDFVRVSTYLTKIGSGPVLQHGHVWSEIVLNPYRSTAPQPSDFQTELGGISEKVIVPYVFTSYVKDLTPSTLYYVRAYVETQQGTFYGPSTQFLTKEKGHYYQR